MEIKNEEKKTEKKSFKQVSKLDLILIIILIIGMLIRIVGIGCFPNALNCDEASSGYEAFSILNYGIDRNRK